MASRKHSRQRMSVPGANVGQRLLRDLAVILILTIGAMTAATLILGGRVKQDLAVGHIEGTMSVATQDLRRLFEPVKQLLLMTRRWGMAGELNPLEPEDLNRRFVPALQTVPQIEGLLLAGQDGVEYFLLRDGENWLTRSRAPKGGELLWRRWSRQGELTDQWKERSMYDPRERPWFQGALSTTEPESLYWTKPYSFHSRKAPGVTAAIRYDIGGDAEHAFVIGADVLLSEVAERVADFEVGGQGKAFLVSGDGAVILAPPESATPTDKEDYTGLFTPSRYPQGDLLVDSIQRWAQVDMPRNEPVRFISSSEPYWASFAPVYADRDVLWLGVVVPESDFLGVLSRRGTILVTVGLVALALGIVLAVRVVGKYRRLMKDMPKTSIDPARFAEEVYALIRVGESSHLEFKSTLRNNLKTGKPGKEIELAWLKGVVAFLNTAGGILLIGVGDDGEILGIEADGFENEDKIRLHFKNLINQHIGLEFSKFIQLDLQPVEGKLIAAIECERSSEPAFLFAKNDESFFIRSGPASVKLPVSKALKYIQER